MEKYDKEIRIRPTRPLDQELIAKISAEAESRYMSTTQFVKLILAQHVLDKQDISTDTSTDTNDTSTDTNDKQDSNDDSNSNSNSNSN